MSDPAAGAPAPSIEPATFLPHVDTTFLVDPDTARVRSREEK